jgi:hypothetical protein
LKIFFESSFSPHTDFKAFVNTGTSVAVPHHFDTDPDPACKFDANADPDPAFDFPALDPACIFYTDPDPACPDPDDTFNFDADPDPCFQKKA